MSIPDISDHSNITSKETNNNNDEEGEVIVEY